MSHAVQDFQVFSIDEWVIPVAFSMVFDQNTKCLLIPVLRQEPSRGFWNKPDEDELQHCRGHLKK